MQAIVTKFIPPTNVKAARIKAKCDRGEIVVQWDLVYDKGGEQPFEAAARLLAEKFILEDTKRYGTTREENPWNREFITGSLPGSGYVHVFVQKETICNLTGN